ARPGRRPDRPPSAAGTMWRHPPGHRSRRALVRFELHAARPAGTAPHVRRPMKTTSAAHRAALRRRWYEQGWYGQETLGRAQQLGAAQHPATRIVFHSDQRPGSLTLGEAHDRAQRMAGAFHGLGLVQGDVLAVQLPNWTELAIAHYAAMALGLVL